MSDEKRLVCLILSLYKKEYEDKKTPRAFPNVAHLISAFVLKPPSFHLHAFALVVVHRGSISSYGSFSITKFRSRRAKMQVNTGNESAGHGKRSSKNVIVDR